MIIQVLAVFRQKLFKQKAGRTVAGQIIAGRRLIERLKGRALSATALASLLFAPSCILQDRNDLINQSQEGQVVSIKELANLKCQLYTGPRREKKVPSSKARTFLLERKDANDDSYADAKEEPVWYDYYGEKGEKKRGLLNNFGYVPVKSVKPQKSSGGEIKCRNLLSKNIHPILKARSNHSYEVRFQVRAGLVRALIVDKPENLPFSAQAAALKLENGRLAAPIGGWKAPAVYPENQRNPDQEDTHILLFRPRDITAHDGFEDLKTDGIPHRYPSGAKYVQFSDGLFKPYQTLEETSRKEDVYPKSFFQGEWFYSAAPITSSSDGRFGGGYAQHWMSLDQEGKKAPVIRFVFEENFMKAQNIDRETEENPETTLSVNPDRWVMSIPLKNKDYSSRQIGKDLNAGLSEAEDSRASFRDRPLAQFDFHSVKSVIDRWIEGLHRKTGISKSSYSLEELTFSNDYFSFLLKEQSLNFTIRYSFLRRKKPEESSYSPLFLTDKMMQLFPAYSMAKRVSLEDFLTSSRNYQERAPVARFNLQQKPVKYYFSEMTPEDESVRAFGYESVNIWNQVFEKAGVQCPGGLCFELDDSKTVPLGDLRYNVFNLINPKEGGNAASLYGYGPSLADYETGEIVSATSNLNVLRSRRILLRAIALYIQRETGMAGLFYERTALAGSSRAGSGRAGRLSSDNAQSLMIKKSLLKVPLSFLASFAKAPFFNEITGPSRAVINNAASLPAPDALSGLQDIYGFRETKDGRLAPVLSLEETLTEEEKSEMRLQYELLTGETPPKDLKELSQVLEKHEEEHALRGRCDLQHQKAGGALMGDRIFSLIDRLCRQDLSFIPSLKNKTAGLSPHLQRRELYLEKGKEDVEQEIHACADKILPLAAFKTTLHEMGHNINMRHQFAGSADTANFLKNDDFSHAHIAAHLEDEEKAAAFDLLQPESASIMDYVADPYISPGAYDIAHARFYYAGRIEGADGEIHEALLEQEDPTGGKALKTYRVCTDEHAWDFKNFGGDIFCNLFDKGGTAYEIVQNYYNQWINLPSQFLNQAFPRGRQSPAAFGWLTRKIYTKWRVKISEYLNREDSNNLSNIREKEWVDQTLDSIGANRCKREMMTAGGGFEPEDWTKTTDCVCAAEDTEELQEQAKNCIGEEAAGEACQTAILRDLYCARGKIARTFYDLLFEAHDHYCHTESLLTGRREIIPFSRLHRALRAEDGESLREVSSCYDIKEELQAAGWKLEKETGYPLFPGVFAANINRWSRDWPKRDYRGSFPARFASGAFFLIHTALKKAKELESDIYISLLDEPDIRKSVRKRVTDRIAKGIKIPETQVAEQSAAEEAPQQAAAPAFQGLLRRKESHYYNFENENLLWGILSPHLLRIHPFIHYAGFISNVIVPSNVRVNLPEILKGWNPHSPGPQFLTYLAARSRFPIFYLYNALPEPGAEPQGSPIILFNPSEDPELENSPAYHLTNALEEQDLAESFKIFGENLLEWNRKSAPSAETKYTPCAKRTAGPLPDFSGIEEAGAAITAFIKQNITNPVFCLIFKSETKEIPVSRTFALAYSLLYDYLIDGQKISSYTRSSQELVSRQPRFITSAAIEILQAGLIKEYGADNPDFLERCEKAGAEGAGRAHKQAAAGLGSDSEESACFQGFYLEDFWTEHVPHERRPDIRINWLKPYLRVLKRNETNACGNEKLQKTALALYHLEAFRPDAEYSESGETKTELLSLLQTAFGSPTESGCRPADDSHPWISAARINADFANDYIKQLRILKTFRQSRFLREIFFLYKNHEMQNVITGLLDILVKFQADSKIRIISSLQRNENEQELSESDARFLDQRYGGGADLSVIVSKHSQAFNALFKDMDKAFGDAEETSGSFEAGTLRRDFSAAVQFSFENMEIQSDLLRHVLNYLAESNNAGGEGVFNAVLQKRLNDEMLAQEKLLMRALNPFVSIDFIRQ